MHAETKKEGEILYDGKIVKLHLDKVELENGAEAMREYVTHPGGAAVVAEKDGKIIFVRQFRYVYGKEVLEIPAGKRENGEDPHLTALRELKEETGYVAEKLTFLGELYPSPGYTDEIIYLYAADGLWEGKSSPDEDEFVSVEYVPAEQAAQMVASGEIKDAKTVAALMKYFCFHRKV